jgi:hypothetical protein
MIPFTYWVKFYKGDSVVQMSIKALHEAQVLEQLGITKDQLIECRIVDGI